MKAKVFFIACLAAMSCSVSVSAASKGKVEKTYDVGKDFKELNISRAVDVMYSEAADVVTVIADEELMPYVVVERRGDDLNILISNFERNRNNVDICVVVPVSRALESVSVRGASSFKSDVVIKAADFEVDASGASTFVADIDADGCVGMECTGASGIKADVKARSLDVEVSGASDVKVSGNVTDADIEVSGASGLGDRDGKRLVADNVKVYVSGASDVRIRCNETIKGSVSGASSMKYTGKAVSSVKTSGASSVSNR